MPHRNPVLHPKRKESAAKQVHDDEAVLLGEAAFITLVIVVAQSFIIWQFVSSVTLMSDTLHTASDLVINIGAFVATLVAGHSSPVKGERIKQWFAFIGIAMLALSALWVAQEAQERLVSPLPLKNGWLIITGIIGGMGNFWVHTILSRTPREERSSAHVVLDAHVLSDMVLSAIVVVAGTLGYLFDWSRADPALSLVAAVWMMVMSGILFYGMLAHGKPCAHRH